MGTFRDTANLIANVTNQFIVRPLTLFNTNGVSGFIFDVLDEEQLSIDSDITDHYVEDNYAIQDHISLRPVRFTLKGYVAELNNVFPKNDNLLPKIISRLIDVQQFLPQFAAQAEQLYTRKLNTFQKAQTVFSLASNAYSLVRQFSTEQNKQQNAYNFFYAMWVSRQLCTVETPWGVFTDMAIENIRTMQGGVTRFISDFSISFKQIRTTSTVITSGNTESDNPEGSGAVSGTSSANRKSVDGRISNNTATVSQGPIIGDKVHYEVFTPEVGAPFTTVPEILGAPNTVLPPLLPPPTPIPIPISVVPPIPVFLPVNAGLL